MRGMSGNDEGTTKTMRIGVLDNDRCALDCLTGMLRAFAQTVDRPIDIWSTVFPTEALQICADSSHPTDILLIDMALNGVTGPQLAPMVLETSPHTHLIGITSYDVSTYRAGARKAGIPMLLDKAELSHALAPAIIAAAQRPVDADSAAPTVTTPVKSTDGKPLSVRETQIVAMSIGSLNNKQIGARLGISPDTISSHRRNIKRKLNVTTWYEALDKCRELHIV